MNAKELFINDRRNETVALLTDAVENLLGCVSALELEVANLKLKRGNRISDRSLDDDVARQRERAYEVAYIKVKIAHEALFAAIGAVHQAAARVRSEEIDGDEGKYYSLRPLAKNNVMCALELADEAAALYHETEQKQMRVVCAGYTFAIDRDWKKVDEVGDNPREWVVIMSAWGGSASEEERKKVENTPPPYMTLQEAISAAGYWCGLADTIGGDAALYNVRTREHRLRWY